MSRSVPAFLIALALPALACNLPFAAPATSGPAAPPATEAAPAGPAATAMPALPTVAPTPTAFPVPARGGFSTGDLDPALLPRVPYIVTGRGPVMCSDPASGPAITLAQEVGDLYKLCLYGFSTEPGSSPVTVTVNAPDGRSSTETFSVELDAASGSKVVVGQRTGSRTSLYEEPGFPAALMVFMEVSAFFPAGEYQLTASTADGSVSASGAAIVPNSPQTSILPYGEIPDLFASYDWYTPGGRASENVVFYGRGYAPRSMLIVALLDQNTIDSTAFTVQVSHATQVMTSEQGEYTAIFYVGPEQSPGIYNVSVAATMAELIHEPFGEAFNVTP